MIKKWKHSKKAAEIGKSKKIMKDSARGTYGSYPIIPASIRKS